MSGTGPSAVGRLHPADIVTRSGDVIWRRVDDEVVILNDEGTTLTTLNPTAAVAWEAMDGSVSIERVARCVAARFDEDPARVLDDIVELCQGLRDAALVSIAPAPASDGAGDTATS